VDVKDVARVTDSLADATEQARALAHGLRGISDLPNALPGALKNLVDWIRTASSLACRFISARDAIVIKDAGIANHVFRIAQEAVNNAVRHSGATLLTLRIETMPEGNFALTVLDNGSGFDPMKLLDRGIGLRTMEYRARAIGASFRIKRRKKGGTRVECIFSDR
jgi:signal transduction histidine kinase